MIKVRKVVGESMLPTLRHGAVVFGVSYKKPRLGDIVIAKLNGREVIKRIAGKSDRGYFLLGDNPMASTDSRVFGWITPDAVKSVVVNVK